MMRRLRKRNMVGYVVNDKNVNVIIRSQLITAYMVLGFYLLIRYSSNYIKFPVFIQESMVIIGGLIFAWVLWHTVNYAVAKKIIKQNK